MALKKNTRRRIFEKLFFKDEILFMFFFALWKQIKDQEFNMENLAEEWKVESKDAVNACSECTVMHLHTLLHPPLLCGCNFSSFHGPVCCLNAVLRYKGKLLHFYHCWHLSISSGIVLHIQIKGVCHKGGFNINKTAF